MFRFSAQQVVDIDGVLTVTGDITSSDDLVTDDIVCGDDLFLISDNGKIKFGAQF